MRSKEELCALREEVETVSRKLRELTEEELEQVFGGTGPDDFNNFDCGVSEIIEKMMEAIKEIKEKANEQRSKP